MAPVRGLRVDSGSVPRGGGGEVDGCRPPHRPQKASRGPTWFPHWLQKGIRQWIRDSRPPCSGNLLLGQAVPPARPHAGDSSSFGHATIFAMRLLLPGLLLLVLPVVMPAAKNLEVYSIDVEGGQATLLVSPSGASMLVD